MYLDSHQEVMQSTTLIPTRKGTWKGRRGVVRECVSMCVGEYECMSGRVCVRVHALRW